ncbi:hypothetical protein BASA81_008361 [Batrachochytrium salamandrivorans]|nr:hypothetical protein BASA81_008361 [Batrachochytrium salamandrivorans]
MSQVNPVIGLGVIAAFAVVAVAAAVFVNQPQGRPQGRPKNPPQPTSIQWGPTNGSSSAPLAAQHAPQAAQHAPQPMQTLTEVLDNAPKLPGGNKAWTNIVLRIQQDGTTYLELQKRKLSLYEAKEKRVAYIEESLTKLEEFKGLDESELVQRLVAWIDESPSIALPPVASAHFAGTGWCGIHLGVSSRANWSFQVLLHLPVRAPFQTGLGNAVPILSSTRRKLQLYPFS